MKIKDLTMITSRGSVTLFFMAFITAFIIGNISLLIAKESTTVVTLTAIGGVLSTMSISKIASLLGMKFAVSNNSGILGTILALLVILILI